VTAGSVEVNSTGRPGWRTLTNTQFLAGTPPVPSSAEFTLLALAQITAMANGLLFQLGNGVQAICPAADGQVSFDLGSSAPPARISGPSGIAAGNSYVASFGASVSSAAQYARINGISRASDSSGNTVSTTGLSLMGSGSVSQIGMMAEIAAFPSQLSGAALAAAERNIATAFNVSVA
jgi:hypothetical protein